MSESDLNMAEANLNISEDDFKISEADLNNSESDLPSTEYKLCAKRSNIIIFSIISVLCALFVMIGFYTFFTSREKSEETIPNFQNQMNFTVTNTCQWLEFVGDNHCDDEANIENCLYDSGDCCDYKSDKSTCQDCFCYVPKSDLKANRTWSIHMFDLGDGECDLRWNNIENYFDVGDCCLNNTRCVFDSYPDLKPQDIPIGTETKHPCPEDICVKSNIYCISSQLGDGLCQDHNNGPLCDLDLGDCCLPSRYDFDTCVECNCRTLTQFNEIAVY